MRYFAALPVAFAPCALAASRLFATHYDGTVSELSLTSSGLRIENKQVTCGRKPSWLTYDASAKIMYCLDENQYTPGTNTPGSFSAYTVQDGVLSEFAKVPIFADGVHGTVYGGDNGNSFFAIAHYYVSKLSTFKLPLTNSSTPNQIWAYTMAQPGPVPDRQNAPHPHEAKLDPTGSYVLVPDLGADLIRISSIDQDSGTLTNCHNQTAKPGRGPRHLSFHVPASQYERDVTGRRKRDYPDSESTTMYVDNELANTVTAYSVAYDESCMSFTETQEISTYPDGNSPPETKLAEVQVKGQSLTVSNRYDNSFGASNDSLAVFTIGSDGGLTFDSLYPTFASFPRSMSINKVGDMVAIGNQASAEVTVVERDPETGRLGRLLGSAVIGTAGSGENGGSGGMSSVVWEE